MGLLIILRLAPVDNINNKMNYEEKNYLKKKIRAVLMICTLLTGLSSKEGTYQYASSSYLL